MLALTSCGEYQRILKSTNPDEKLDFARRAFEQKRYTQATTVLTDIVTQLKGTKNAEESLYLLALSYYENKDYYNSGLYFHTYYSRYPKGKYAELARFYSGYGYYLDSPEPQLDQSETIKGIEELQAFLDYYPRTKRDIRASGQAHPQGAAECTALLQSRQLRRQQLRVGRDCGPQRHKELPLLQVQGGA